MKIKKLLTSTLVIGFVLLPGVSLAHRSGCHTLHSCLSDSSSYVCGDLGYPCDDSSSIKDVPLSAINVPLLVEQAFLRVFGRDIEDNESVYWKARFRSDKSSLYKIRRVMAWHKANDSFGPIVAVVATKDGNATEVKNINALFRLANNGTNPTVSENAYWISRIKDKPNETEMTGAMAWHRVKNILH